MNFDKDGGVISPVQFFSAFKRVAYGARLTLIERWKCSTYYTKCMREIFPRIAEDLQMQYYGEFWSLDAILYRDRDTENFPRTTYPYSISVAIEHENDASTSTEEIIRLMRTRSAKFGRASSAGKWSSSSGSMIRCENKLALAPRFVHVSRRVFIRAKW